MSAPLLFTQEAGDRELPLIVGVMPILSKKVWEGRNFDEMTLTPLVGSGPYVIEKRNPVKVSVTKKTQIIGDKACHH